MPAVTSADGTRIAYTATGIGPTLIYLGGAIMHRGTDDDCGAGMAPRSRCSTPSSPTTAAAEARAATPCPTRWIERSRTSPRSSPNSAPPRWLSASPPAPCSPSRPSCEARLSRSSPCSSRRSSSTTGHALLQHHDRQGPIAGPGHAVSGDRSNQRRRDIGLRDDRGKPRPDLVVQVVSAGVEGALSGAAVLAGRDTLRPCPVGWR